MHDAKPNPMFRWMPSLADVAFLMPLVFLFTRLEGVRTLLGDGDTGWHIRTGEWILANHRVPYADIFSFTKPGEPWFAWEWLWDAMFAWLYLHGGLAAVVLVNMLILCATSVLLYRLVNRRCGHPVLAIGLTVLALAGSTLHWLARPHLFTMLFVVVFLTVIEAYRTADLPVRAGRPGPAEVDAEAEGVGRGPGGPPYSLLLWLPALTILWTNLHGGFLAGIVILGIYGVGELARALVVSSSIERRSAIRAAIPYLAAAAGCAAASLVNPYFYHLHVHIWNYLRDADITRGIVEFQAANFQYGGAGYLEAMLILAVGAAIWHAMRKQFSDVLILAAWAHLALLVARNIPLFMFVAAPAVSVAMADWLRRLREAPVADWIRNVAASIEGIGKEIAPLERIGRFHVICVAALVAVALGMSSPSAGSMLKPEFDPKAYPERALAFVNHPGQRVFTHDEWGDYLIWRLAPAGGKVFVDGRSDFYGAKFSREYLDLLGVKYDWEQTLAQYGVDTILLPPNAPLSTAVKESAHWHVVYDDGSAIVFRATGAPIVGQQVSRGEQEVYTRGIHPL